MSSFRRLTSKEIFFNFESLAVAGAQASRLAVACQGFSTEALGCIVGYREDSLKCMNYLISLEEFLPLLGSAGNFHEDYTEV